MADIEASKPRAQLVHHADLPQRERGAPRVAEQFWRQAATRKDRPPSKRRPHTLPRSKRKSLPLALKRWGPRCTARERAPHRQWRVLPGSQAVLHVSSKHEHSVPVSKGSTLPSSGQRTLLSVLA